MFTAFVSGFFATLGAFAAVAAIGVILSIPAYFIIRKKVAAFHEVMDSVQAFNALAEKEKGQSTVQ
jgi:hypothetical protein